MGTTRALADGDLERRRLAIVRALRGDPGPPPSSPTAAVVSDDRLNRLERDVAAVQAHLAELSGRLRHVVDERRGGPASYPAYPTAPPADAGGLEDELLESTPRVPPVEPVAPMSDSASRALFGY